MAIQYPKRLRGWRFGLFNLCLGVSHGLVISNGGAYIAMLPRVAGGLGIPLSYSTWTQTDYMVGLALAFPIGNWLARRYGEYRPFVAAFVVFAAASLVCASTHEFYLFLLGRVLLGLAGGVTLPLGQALLIKEYSDKRKSFGAGVWSLFSLTPFTLGPPLGGWIADTLGWRWLFWINLPLALLIAGATGALLYGRGAATSRRRFDGVGFTLFAVVFFGLQTVLNQGNDWDWGRSSYILALSVLIVVTLAYAVIWELSLQRPFLDVRLFAGRNFLIAVTTLFLGFLMFQGLLSMLIVQLQVTMGYSSLLAGLVFLPMAVFAKPIAGVFHEIVKRNDARLLASANMLGFAAVYFWLSRFDDLDSFEQLLWPKLLEGVCLGSFFVPLTVLLLHGLPVERHMKALEFANLLRIAAGAIGITLQGIVIYRRTPVHMTRFAENHSELAIGQMQAVQNLSEVGFEPLQALAKFSKLTTKAEVIRSMNDAFWLAGCVFVGLSLLVWFAHPTRLPRKVTAQQDLRMTQEELVMEDD